MRLTDRPKERPAPPRTPLGNVLAFERRRAALEVRLLRASLLGGGDTATSQGNDDRVARALIQRWRRAAAVGGGMSGAFGLLGLPADLALLGYCQVALTVAIATAYGVELKEQAGEEALLAVLRRANGFDAPSAVAAATHAAGPRVLALVARSLLLRRGLPRLARLVPLLAAPLSARLDARQMDRVGAEACRRFGRLIHLR